MDIEKDGLPLASASASGFMTWHITESEPHRGVAQLVTRRAHNPKVVVSSPTPATKKEQSEMAALFFALNSMIQWFHESWLLRLTYPNSP